VSFGRTAHHVYVSRLRARIAGVPDRAISPIPRDVIKARLRWLFAFRPVDCGA
jgi:hypothetical protein